MSLSGKDCEKCNGTGRVTEMIDVPAHMGGESFPSQRPCGACSEPWGPQWLDAPDGDGLWWMLAEGRAPEPVVIAGLCRVRDRVVCRVRRIGRDGSLAFDDPDLGRALRWLRLTPPEVPQ